MLHDASKLLPDTPPHSCVNALLSSFALVYCCCLVREKHCCMKTDIGFWNGKSRKGAKRRPCVGFLPESLDTGEQSASFVTCLPSQRSSFAATSALVVTNLSKETTDLAIAQTSALLHTHRNWAQSREIRGGSANQKATW